jgi:hypothetical protein
MRTRAARTIPHALRSRHPHDARPAVRLQEPCSPTMSANRIVTLLCSVATARLPDARLAARLVGPLEGVPTGADAALGSPRARGGGGRRREAVAAGACTVRCSITCLQERTGGGAGERCLLRIGATGACCNCRWVAGRGPCLGKIDSRIFCSRSRSCESCCLASICAARAGHGVHIGAARTWLPCAMHRTITSPIAPCHKQVERYDTHRMRAKRAHARAHLVSHVVLRHD